MNRQDVMAAALQLQRHAGFMASNLPVLDQYVMSLNRMSSEVLHPDGSHGIVASTDCQALSGQSLQEDSITRVFLQ